MSELGKVLPVTVLAIALAGCPTSGEGKKTGPPGSGVLSDPPAPHETLDGGTHDATPPTRSDASYEGSYSVAPGSYYIPQSKDYAKVKQAKDDPAKHVGEGTLTLLVDADGKVTGTVDSGPAAPGVIEGSVVDGEIRGFIRRKDPNDGGLTGTFIAMTSGDTASGKLSLAEANAAIVREGKVSLKRK